MIDMPIIHTHDVWIPIYQEDIVGSHSTLLHQAGQRARQLLQTGAFDARKTRKAQLSLGEISSWLL